MITVGNMTITFLREKPKGDKTEAWGWCENDGTGNLTIWVDENTPVDGKWLETLIHEIMHTAEFAFGKKIPHTNIKLLSVVVASVLVQAGFVHTQNLRDIYTGIAE